MVEKGMQVYEPGAGHGSDRVFLGLMAFTYLQCVYVLS
jgi:hypothetical protein